jgi:hypothetical protein
MKHNYALGIKKIIILWIVVFLGGYVLNSFFKKINSLDEGLYARSNKIPPGFQVEYNGKKSETYRNTWNGTSGVNNSGNPTLSTRGGPVSQIKVSMIANQTPAPASVSGLPNALGCAGPRFGLTGKQMYPKMNQDTKQRNWPFIHGGNFSSFWWRKLSKSECQMFKRGIDCTSKPQDYVSSAYLPNGYTKGDNGVLPVVSRSIHGMGCVAYYVSNGQGTGRRVVWNTGCKPSSIRGGVCTVGKGSSGVGWSGTGGAHTVLWSFPRRKDTGRGARAKGQGVWHPSLPSQVAKGNNLSNWDEFGIPIEAGDGIPRKKKAPPPPAPKPKPKPKPKPTPAPPQAGFYSGKNYTRKWSPNSTMVIFSDYQKWRNIGTKTPPESWSIPPSRAVWWRVRNASYPYKVRIFYKFTGTVPDSASASQYYWVKDKWKRLSAANTSLICEFYLKTDDNMKLPTWGSRTGNYNIPGGSVNVAGVGGQYAGMWFKQ